MRVNRGSFAFRKDSDTVIENFPNLFGVSQRRKRVQETPIHEKRRGILLCAQRTHRILFGSASGGDDPGEQGQRHADENQNQGRPRGEISVERADAGEMVQDHIDGDAQQISDKHPQGRRR